MNDNSFDRQDAEDAKWTTGNGRRRELRYGPMGTAEQPKRRRFQFHLSTAIAMMVVTSAFLGLNVILDIAFFDCQLYGFPLKFLVIDRKEAFELFLWTRLAANLCALLLCLGFTSAMLEWLIRRRARRTTS